MLPLYAARIEDLGRGDGRLRRLPPCRALDAGGPLRFGLVPRRRFSTSKDGSGAADADGGDGRSFPLDGGGKRMAPVALRHATAWGNVVAALGIPWKARRRMGGSSRCRSPLGLVRPDRNPQAGSILHGDRSTKGQPPDAGAH